MAVDAQHPFDLGRDLLLKRAERFRQLVELLKTRRRDRRRADIEEDLRREDEAVALDADVGTVGENFAQAPEEVRAIARQFLHALRQSDVQTRTEIGDLGLAFTAARF